MLTRIEGNEEEELPEVVFVEEEELPEVVINVEEEDVPITSPPIVPSDEENDRMNDDSINTPIITFENSKTSDGSITTQSRIAHYKNMTMEKLRKELRDRNMDVSGKKDVLVDRLMSRLDITLQ